jgi:hypothetical protein
MRTRRKRASDGAEPALELSATPSLPR